MLPLQKTTGGAPRRYVAASRMRFACTMRDARASFVKLKGLVSDGQDVLALEKIVETMFTYIQ